MNYTPSSTRPPRSVGPGTPDDAVLNTRRPKLVVADNTDEAVHAASHPGQGMGDRLLAGDAQLPPTLLKLPDLALLGRRLSSIRWSSFRLSSTQWNKHTASEIAQWSGICLGGLLALWLIFGNRRGEMARPGETPAWTAPEQAQAAPAAPWTPPAPDAPEAPRWEAPSAPAASASPSAAKPAPAYESHSMLPGTGGLLTAQREKHSDPPRPAPSDPPAATSPGGEIQPLGITVPVPQ